MVDRRVCKRICMICGILIACECEVDGDEDDRHRRAVSVP